MDRLVRLIIRQKGQLVMDEKYPGYFSFELDRYIVKEETLENEMVITKYYKFEGLQDESYQPT
jgi:hypothetical protein